MQSAAEWIHSISILLYIQAWCKTSLTLAVLEVGEQSDRQKQTS